MMHPRPTGGWGLPCFPEPLLCSLLIAGASLPGLTARSAPGLLPAPELIRRKQDSAS